ncbi:hypothetical protein RE474_00900 [Methanolobus sediminis]|uniref:Uncharacterized protein n=1 Tax=Methanolobus sediminis TaxID=3072978 RepID=A0AA51ULI7_9EURY|nr:hypothetical protein [Methanolobus sediminis]WMW25308.1 hypothetical protein RE474_00900 [Methanolobus sediminis]
MKNVISKSFEIKDYMLDDTVMNGFWMNLIDREKLTTEVVYSSVDAEGFSLEDTKRLVTEITEKCDHFKTQLPENINCEVVFKDFNDLKYSANDNEIQFDSKELDEIRVVYRFCVGYHI